MKHLVILMSHPKKPGQRGCRPGSSQPVADPVAGKRSCQVATGFDSTRDWIGCSYFDSAYSKRLSLIGA
jgi:hypothetical protein